MSQGHFWFFELYEHLLTVYKSLVSHSNSLRSDADSCNKALSLVTKEMSDHISKFSLLNSLSPANPAQPPCPSPSLEDRVFERATSEGRRAQSPQSHHMTSPVRPFPGSSSVFSGSNLSFAPGTLISVGVQTGPVTLCLPPIKG